MKKETILVTGGAGFIGSHIVEACIREGYDVNVLDDLSTGNLSNLYYASGHFKFFEGSIENRELVSRAMEGCNYVIHQAAQIEVLASNTAPTYYHDVNVTGTLNILAAAKCFGVKKVVFAASAASQGTSFYGLTKYVNELYAKWFTSQNLEGVGLRYQNVFGPRQDSCVMPKFVRKLVKNESPILYGDGSQTRDFIYVKDVARANLIALKQSKIGGKTFNVASGMVRSVLSVYRAIQQELGVYLDPIYMPRPEGEIINIIPVTLDQEFEWKPETSFEEGLKKTVEYYKKNG